MKTKDGMRWASWVGVLAACGSVIAMLFPVRAFFEHRAQQRTQISQNGWSELTGVIAVVEAFKQYYNRLPTDLDEVKGARLVVPLPPCQAQESIVIENSVELDGRGIPFQYMPNTSGFELSAAGPDGEYDTDDDQGTVWPHPDYRPYDPHPVTDVVASPSGTSAQVISFIAVKIRPWSKHHAGFIERHAVQFISVDGRAETVCVDLTLPANPFKPSKAKDRSYEIVWKSDDSVSVYIRYEAKGGIRTATANARSPFSR